MSGGFTVSQPTFQPACYSVPCPRCAAPVPLPRNSGWRQRTICGECRYLVTATWTDGAIVLASYPMGLPRRDAVPRQYPQTRMEPVQQGPENAYADVPRPRRGPRPDDGPDWEGARRRVTRAMNGLR